MLIAAETEKLKAEIYAKTAKAISSRRSPPSWVRPTLKPR